MTVDDLMALSERLLNQLELNYGVRDDREALFVLTDDDDAILITTYEVDMAEGAALPILNFHLPVFAEIDLDSIDWLALNDLNAAMNFGSILLDREDRTLGVDHLCVGWPGVTEYRAALELLVSAAEEVREALQGEIVAEAPRKFSEIVS